MQLEPSQNDRTWGMWAHLSALSALLNIPFGNILGPLIIYLSLKNKPELPSATANAGSSA